LASPYTFDSYIYSTFTLLYCLTLHLYGTCAGCNNTAGNCD